jgi:hypothetical protein
MFLNPPFHAVMPVVHRLNTDKRAVLYLILRYIVRVRAHVSGHEEADGLLNRPGVNGMYLPPPVSSSVKNS